MRYIILSILFCVFMSCNKTRTTEFKQENCLRINVRREPVSIDPRKGNDMIASQIHFMLFEGLLRLNPDMSVSLAQAESYDVSDDYRTYTFHLKNTQWSDGTPVTAYDFEKSWKKILEPAFNSPDAYLLYPIKGAKQAKKGEIPIDEVGIVAKDQRTLIVELQDHTPYFLHVIASSVLLPVNAKIDAQDPNWANSVDRILCNGPFRLAEWVPNQSLTFEKNPLYHQAHSVHLERVFVDVIDRELACLHMYASGHFDLIGAPLSFFPAILLEDQEAKKFVSSFPVAATKFLAFNTSAYPFHNRHIRRAFALALDRHALVEHVTHLSEQAALNVIPPALLSTQRNLFADGDIRAAKEAFQQGLQEMGVDKLGKVSLMYVGNELNHSLAQAFVQMWKQALGIEVILQQSEFKTLHDRAKRSDFNIGLFAWLADYGDPINILERFTDKTNHRNYSKWEHEGYKQLLVEALKAHSRAEYIEKMQQAEEILIEEMPFTCLFHENFSFLIHRHVQGFSISPLGHIYFDRIWIDPSQKMDVP